MKKLLIFFYNLNNYSETFISDEIEYIKNEKSFQTTLLHYGASDKDKSTIGLNIPNNFIARCIKSPRSLNLKLLKHRNGNRFVLQYLIKFFQKNQFDLIYCHFGPNGKLIAELKHLGYIPPTTELVVRFHGMDLVKKVYPRGYYQLFRNYANILIVGTEYARSLLMGYDIPARKIVTIPVGIKAKFLSSKLARRKSDDVWNLISVGRLVEFKGHLEAIEVMRVLRRDGIKFKYTIIGSGPLRYQIGRLLEKYLLRPFVDILSPVPHQTTLQLISECDVYIHAGITDRNGREETQGLANIEAMAAGLPIISSPVGGVSDYVIDNYTGFICESRNCEEFAGKIRWVMENYNTRHLTMIRTNAVNLIKKNYTQEVLNARLVEILLSPER